MEGGGGEVGEGRYPRGNRGGGGVLELQLRCAFIKSMIAFFHKWDFSLITSLPLASLFMELNSSFALFLFFFFWSN